MEAGLTLVIGTATASATNLPEALQLLDALMSCRCQQFGGRYRELMLALVPTLLNDSAAYKARRTMVLRRLESLPPQGDADGPDPSCSRRLPTSPVLQKLCCRICLSKFPSRIGCVKESTRHDLRRALNTFWLWARHAGRALSIQETSQPHSNVPAAHHPAANPPGIAPSRSDRSEIFSDISPTGKSPRLRRGLRVHRACQQLNIRRCTFRRELRNQSIEGPAEPGPDRSPELTRARQHARIANTMAEHHQVIHLCAQPRPKQIATGKRLWVLHAGPKLSTARQPGHTRPLLCANPLHNG